MGWRQLGRGGTIRFLSWIDCQGCEWRRSVSQVRLGRGGQLEEGSSHPGIEFASSALVLMVLYPVPSFTGFVVLLCTPFSPYPPPRTVLTIRLHPKVLSELIFSSDLQQTRHKLSPHSKAFESPTVSSLRQLRLLKSLYFPTFPLNLPIQRFIMIAQYLHLISS